MVKQKQTFYHLSTLTEVSKNVFPHSVLKEVCNRLCICQAGVYLTGQFN